MIELADDEFKFSSGRTLYANCGIIGISPRLKLSYGYDGDITWPIPDWWANEKWYSEEQKERELTHADMSELADMMIERWTKFKASLEVPSEFRLPNE